MLSSRPYLARGLYEWLLDNEQTPYIVVDAEQPGVSVPRQFVQNGQIVLNVGPTAVRDLQIENDAIYFGARFGGQPMQVVVPMPALVAIYAKENGVGMVFGHEPAMPMPQGEESTADAKPELSSIDSPEREGEGSAPESGREGKTPSRKRPSLRVIK
ncbi:ClpXP protease specificity-enhancing factor [Billgrantia desiderata]|uniref:ClpXP protease specificity-enhancing factor n=1 Tax=Billgrantia desiderata TaxID=52021 RepID=A0ABS9B3C6_9GAMM|nr:ClpXP protease specificity-enhancing factor [Halomonas desiderata]MCE8011269.1 ClpXP protease specificity-enhancing factor [Halomonas desiderata]MCE8029418.1 ClpXP protease specificity-enhancing factor [Halomonas desiderata]MCE8041844.1 ClpXP protease specificity-enhancing factor [Halomonas desiderata]MCE8046419.1 ClpXP protease specificity-enhancing factor [Halomonas desiderata]